MAKVIDKQNIVKASSSGGTDIQGTLLYAEVDVDAGEIATISSVPIVLLPALATPNTYYDIEKCILEYTHVTTAYTFAAPVPIQLLIGNHQASASNSMLEGITNSYYPFSGTHGGLVDFGNADLFGFSADVQASFRLTSLADPIGPLGDGTMKVKIWYYIKTFG